MLDQVEAIGRNSIETDLFLRLQGFESIEEFHPAFGIPRMTLVAIYVVRMKSAQTCLAGVQNVILQFLARAAGRSAQTSRYAANSSPNNTLTSMTYSMPVADWLAFSCADRKTIRPRISGRISPHSRRMRVKNKFS
jgi:hypothetical protein